MSKTNVPVALGLMTFGKEGAEGARVHKIEDCEAMLDIFQKHGHKEVDTARTYAGGSSEEYLGQIDWKKRGLVIDTKLAPHHAIGITHSREDLRKHIEVQLKTIKSECFDMWYLHAPDRTVPYEETFETVNELYKEGKFKRLGISNYQSWEVAYIVQLCDRNGWIKPTAYQGIYNAVHRAVEPELFPCLRKFGLSFYEFNPLGGGFFTGQYSKDSTVEKGSRFDPERKQGANYRNRYWKQEYFDALDLVKPVAEKQGLTLAEVALRWIENHSLLSAKYGDHIIIGASSVAHLEANLVDLEKGPLPEDVLKALDEAWLHVKAVASNYYH